MRRVPSGLAPIFMIGISLVGGCAVGPNFKRPAAPAANGYTVAPLPAHPGGHVNGAIPAQTFKVGADIPGQWWELFHSKPLDDLITRALARNADLAAAQAALRQARENLYAQEGNYLPSLSGNFSASRNKTATASLSPATSSGNPYYSLYNPGLSVSYNPDVFGLNRRQTESNVALAEMQRDQLEATYLTLTSNLVMAAVNEASIRGQIDATEEIVRIEHDLLDILRKQYALGQVAQLDVLSQEATTTTAEATLPPLVKQLAQQRDQIVALSGGLPNETVPEIFTLGDLRLPDALPVSMPSTLVEQRPDIRQAEANLHSASALIGVAVANRLPLLNLSAEGGSQALLLNALFAPGNGYFSFIGSITQPIFDGGILLHRERSARAAFQQAAEQYRSTVITAFQNVADTLHALQADADTVRVAAVAARAASGSLGITRGQLRLGEVSYLAQLNAEQTALQAKLTLVQARATQLADTAALFQALGGGWWNRRDVKVRDIRGDDVLAILGVH